MKKKVLYKVITALVLILIGALLCKLVMNLKDRSIKPENNTVICTENNEQDGKEQIENELKNDNERGTQNQETNKYISLNNREVIDLLNNIGVDYEKLEEGKYKYNLGKIKLNNKEMDVKVTFEVSYVTYFNKQYKKYNNANMTFEYNGDVIYSFDGIEPGDFYLSVGHFTIYSDIIKRIRSFDDNVNYLTLYDFSGNEIYNETGDLIDANYDNGKIIITEYNEPAEDNSFCKSTYELVNNNGKYEKKLLNVDYNDYIKTSR